MDLAAERTRLTEEFQRATQQVAFWTAERLRLEGELRLLQRLEGNGAIAEGVPAVVGATP